MIQAQIADSKEEIKKYLQNTEPVSINWENLIFNLKYHEIKVLELIYLPEPKPVTFKRIRMFFLKMNYCEMTARRKLKKLENIGLIKVINSGVLLINPVNGLQNNVIKLIRQCMIRYGMEQ
jgi:hypothetical protein